MALSFSGSRLNPLVLMSDPERTPDLLALSRRLPGGSALIYRHFGSPGLEPELRRITRDRGIQFLIGNDPDLAISCEADGVHFSRRTDGATISQWREARPDWIISAAAMKSGPDDRPLQRLDALFVSPVFASDSPSAGTPIGVKALRQLTQTLPCPVFALGGITRDNITALIGAAIAGVASIDGLVQDLRTETMTNTKPKQTVTISREEDGQMIIFTAAVAGETATGELTLRRVADGVWNANHTGVPRAIGGRGVGKALVAAMVEDARQRDYRVVPGCPFVAKLFERKPDWAEGVAA